jgi:hypothetical protein
MSSADPEVGEPGPEALVEAMGTTMLDYLARQRDFLYGRVAEGGAGAVRDFVGGMHESLPADQANALQRGAHEVSALEAKVDQVEFDAAYGTKHCLEATAEALVRLVHVAKGKEEDDRGMSAADLRIYIENEIYPELLKASREHSRQSDNVYHREQQRGFGEAGSHIERRKDITKHTTYDGLKRFDTLLDEHEHANSHLH